MRDDNWNALHDLYFVIMGAFLTLVLVLFFTGRYKDNIPTLLLTLMVIFFCNFMCPNREDKHGN
jgi:hypothetical protein